MARTVAPVELLIETHDAWTSSADILNVLQKAGRDDVGCCWDVKHTYWVAHEVPETSWKRLAPWVRNTHWKDVRRYVSTEGIPEKLREGVIRFAGVLCPTGRGIAPLADAFELLMRDGYDGWFTLEWEKHWHPYVEEPEEAFPAFVSFLRTLEERLPVRGA